MTNFLIVEDLCPPRYAETDEDLQYSQEYELSSQYGKEFPLSNQKYVQLKNPAVRINRDGECVRFCGSRNLPGDMRGSSCSCGLTGGWKTDLNMGAKQPSQVMPKTGLRVDYRNRYVILPRVKSYGESSTVTRSPGRILIEYFRIFPQGWASIWCLFSNSTL